MGLRLSGTAGSIGLRPKKDVATKENEIGTQIIAAAILVHRELGPGLLETVYEAALAYELTQRGLCVQRQVPVPVVYRPKAQRRRENTNTKHSSASQRLCARSFLP